ncbi:hypothetical protein DL98DRAFT_283005 [Cadophora sp. DSE1049]|nr:hypothetical protein DL98DRAFT_283005 [Cadophora sp. DSE1049]
MGPLVRPIPQILLRVFHSNGRSSKHRQLTKRRLPWTQPSIRPGSTSKLPPSSFNSLPTHSSLILVQVPNFGARKPEDLPMVRHRELDPYVAILTIKFEVKNTLHILLASHLLIKSHAPILFPPSHKPIGLLPTRQGTRLQITRFLELLDLKLLAFGICGDGTETHPAY